MDRDSIRKKLIEVIEDQGLSTKKLTDESEFIRDLGFDSLDSVEFVMEVEDEFDLNISDEDAEKLLTLKAALDYLEPRVEDL